MDNILIELEKNNPFQDCEKALLIGFRSKETASLVAEAHIEELEELVRSQGISIAASIIVTLRDIHPRWMIGKGKVAEIADHLRAENINLVVFDEDLSPIQQRNLEKEWNTPVIDRREVILDIFANRASTREAVLQITLARMQYMLPRLTRAWTHLSRQRGGARGNRGKGETQLETDRRLVLNKISGLRSSIAKVRDQRMIRRKKRLGRPVPSVSLVGYTNAGKSSLLNALSGSSVYVEDKPFATLDPTTRRIELPGGQEIILTDTVGFIRKLPHELVDAFHSTLEEAVLAEVILHVVDGSSHEIEEHIAVTEKVLTELEAGQTPRILVLNKSDALSPDQIRWLSACYPDALIVSARHGNGLKDLVRLLTRTLDSQRPEVTVRLPKNRWDIRSRLHNEATILHEEYEEDGILLRVRLNDKDLNRLAPYILSPPESEEGQF